MKKVYNYAIDEDKETFEQFKNCYSQDFVVVAALMPDAHKGYVAPIGSVLITKNFVVPAWVGFDIGCGLISVRIKGKNIFEKINKNIEKIYREVHEKIPMGVGEYSKEKDLTPKTKKEFQKLLEKFESKPYDKNILQYLKNTSLKHLGTLGGGNHFIEIGVANEQLRGSKENKSMNNSRARLRAKEIWLIIHSGSRGIGHEVAKKYMIKASESKKNFEQTFPLNVNSALGKEYLNLLDFALEYALLNRLELSYKVIEIIEAVVGEKLKTQLWVNKNHNHAVLEKGKYIHRKGATPAKKKEKGVIPGNMRDGVFLVEGLGNPKFLHSSSHGAGRLLSRKSARQKITMKEFEESMKGIRGTISQKTLDEAPMAYKNISKVMDAQKKSVKIIKHIKPLINWKG